LKAAGEDAIRRKQAGFHAIYLVLWLVFFAVAGKVAYEFVPVFYTAWKVDEAFKTIVRTMSAYDESVIRARLPDILKAKYIDYDDLPQEFYDNLVIRADGTRLEISSRYHVTIWLLAPPAGTNTGEAAEGNEVKGVEELRTRGRFDFDFEPHAETP
jgi:hypothetical protein